MGRFGNDEIEAVAEVIRSGRLSSFYGSFLGGNKVQDFENAFKEYHGTKFAVSTSSGTTALQTALLACGIGPGDKVITTPYSFDASASSILMVGARPIFVDIDPKTYNIDPLQIESALHSFHRDCKAILVAHMLGNPCDMKRIMKIAGEHNVWVIEDCAQALGAKIGNDLVGTCGHIGCFSFQETKSITSGGEGGMVIADSMDLATKCQKIRNHGEYYANDPNILGYNFRMTEMNAAFGLVQFRKLEQIYKEQIECAEYLCKHMPPALTPPYVTPNTRHIFYIVGCLWNKDKAKITREEFVDAMRDIGWSQQLPGATISVGYKKLLYEVPYIGARSQKYACPNAETVRDRAVWFDIHRFGKTVSDMELFIQTAESVLS